MEMFDLVLIARNHSGVNYKQLGTWGEFIVDTRNAMGDVRVKPGKVWKA